MLPENIRNPLLTLGYVMFLGGIVKQHPGVMG